MLKCFIIVLFLIHKPLIEGFSLFDFFRPENDSFGRDRKGSESMSSSSSSSSSSTFYATEFYNIAKRSRASVAKSISLPKIHLIRIPKAYSSAMSAVARRFVGCKPPGPCCRYPGDPAGSCPSKRLSACGLNNKKVIGCADHYPNLDYLYNKDIISIAMMREPLNRSLSAFFYPGIHHNSDCKLSIGECFEEYCRSSKWRNIAVKMLSGAMPYAAEETCVSRFDFNLQIC